MLRKIHVSIPFCETLKHITGYAKFMKEHLFGNRKLKHDENIALEEECNTIIQRKLPSKFTDSSRFTIPCSTGSLNISHTLCDLGASINLMPLSMIRKLNYGEPKLSRMALTLDDKSIA